MKPLRIRHLASLALVALAFVLSIAFYGRLPELVPTHWNARGEANGFTPKPWGPFVLPIAMTAVYAIRALVPRVSPRGYDVESFRGVFETLLVAILAFLLLVHVLTLLAGTGMDVPMARTIFAGLGILFVVMGNVLGKVRKNFFVGIRTPWTLANDEVWLLTHRLAGKLFVISGVVLFVAGLLGAGTPVVLIAVVVTGVVPVAYSYVVHRRLSSVDGHTSGRGGSDGPA